MSGSYSEHVAQLESGIGPYGKRSFETGALFVDGGDYLAYYEKAWEREESRTKLKSRTPIQLERDRILYSAPLRAQTDKYHVLYSGQRRIVRNYTTHTMRMAHVTRSICRALGLNSDFAEAIALGVKVGATPFIHAAKGRAAEWVQRKIKELDGHAGAGGQKEIFDPPNPADTDFPLPSWIADIQTQSVRNAVKRFVPWAKGKDIEAYSSGQESYWLLTTNHFTRESRSYTFSPETMYGIWRHSRHTPFGTHTFQHHTKVTGAANQYHQIEDCHCTFEALVVRQADDITWIIENLNDANTAVLLNGQPSLYGTLNTFLSKNETNLPYSLLQALGEYDSGGLYTYFIEDFIDHSRLVLDKIGSGHEAREALQTGEKSARIGLSAEAEAYLDKIEEFLRRVVFAEARVKNRTKMLTTVTETCLDLLYDGREVVLRRLIEEQAAVERWSHDSRSLAIQLLDDDVHCVQLSVDVFAKMRDQEIYDFVGLRAL